MEWRSTAKPSNYWDDPGQDFIAQGGRTGENHGVKFVKHLKATQSLVKNGEIVKFSLGNFLGIRGLILAWLSERATPTEGEELDLPCVKD